ncbi:hypothetical protein BpHYR1_003569 [Brachionus plicatilis]|uniref:Uncharacterized protein n=1 Tax=Brachionus plicatilis TaxID=10195 RepID=A0A3M7Q2X2_BRAPC|nr:hypothetical protein BpHYR1_003569 [Brachionus plicatilis]
MFDKEETQDDEDEVESSASDQDENAITIANNPSSVNINEFQSLNDEQLKDKDIQWIKNLIQTHGETKPKLSIFENVTCRILFKQYDNLMIVEDRNGY